MPPRAGDPLIPSQANEPDPPFKALRKTHLLWLLVVLLVLVLFLVPSQIPVLLIVLAVQIYILHLLLNRHRLSPSTQNALRHRLLTTAFFGPPLQFLVSSLLLGVLATLASLLYLRISGISDTLPAANDPGFGEALKGQDTALFEWLMLHFGPKAPLLNKIAFILGTSLVFALIQAVTLRVLAMGYLPMLSRRSESGIQFKQANIIDITDFAVISALGFAMGRTLFSMLGALFTWKLSPPVDIAKAIPALAYLAALLVEQMCIALFIAERDVLASSVRVANAVFIVWGVDFVLKVFASLREGPFHPPTWLVWGVAMPLYLAVLVVFAAWVWKRYRMDCAEEESRALSLHTGAGGA